VTGVTTTDARRDADDLAEINILLTRYGSTLDTEDDEGWVALFTPDCRYEVYGRTFEGHDGLRKITGGAAKGLHISAQALVQLDGDRATSRRSFIFVDRTDHSMRIGWYDDDLVRTPDGWRIQVVRCTFIGPDGPQNRP
jgi:hypothetical protein